MEATQLHEVYRILNECGEDSDCPCGCGADKDRKGKKVLLEPEKKLEKKAKSEAIEALKATIEEARRKIGLKMGKYIKKVMTLRRAHSPRAKTVWKARSAIRAGAANNRARNRR